MRNHKIEMVVFDMAGTTIDEDNLVYKILHQSIASIGVQISFEDILLLGAGKSKKEAIRQVLERVGENVSKVDAIFEKFSRDLKKLYVESDISVFEDLLEVLNQLKNKGVKRVFNTGYCGHISELLLQKTQIEIGNQIDLLVTCEEVEKCRPFPDMIHYAMKKMKVLDSSTVVKIGDTKVDIEEGKNAKVGLTFGVTTGAHTREQLLLASPSYVVDSLQEMINILYK